ncbi:MAG: SatD family protein [Prolixibacteraceae bacterium]
MYASITGDIISSKNISLSQRDLILEKLQTDFNNISENFPLRYPFEFLRGDSFQGVSKDLKDALKITLSIKAIFKKNGITTSDSLNKKNGRSYKNLDARISIGLGPIEYLHQQLSLSDGTALQLSGRSLEKMKSLNQKLIVTTEHDEINRELRVELKLLDAIIEKWTTHSAEVVYYLLQGNNETQTAQKLGISQSAVNQRKKTANWDAIVMLLDNFESLILQFYTHAL